MRSGARAREREEEGEDRRTERRRRDVAASEREYKGRRAREG